MCFGNEANGVRSALGGAWQPVFLLLHQVITMLDRHLRLTQNAHTLLLDYGYRVRQNNAEKVEEKLSRSPANSSISCEHLATIRF